jgi:hypothetical protein
MGFRLSLRQVTVLVGVIFTLMGVGWLVDPARSATGLGMPLLDGLARSTQIGDISSFFLTGGITILIGCLRGNARLLYVPAAMIGGAAITRTLAWSLHGASFALLFIVVEVSTGILLISGALTLDE